MKTPLILRVAALALATITTSFAGGEGWTHDWEAAKKQAATEKKDLLLDFTGSDWCGWCIKLNKEVFSQEGFKTAAKDKFVLVEVDFPRDKSKLSQETQDQNKKLGEQFSIEGYPTIILCDATGKPFAQTGYREGGDQKYVAHLDELRAIKAKRDEGLAAAAKLEGPAKAKALLEALKDIPENLVSSSYPEVIDQIKKADPNDTSGFLKKQDSKNKLQAYRNGLQSFAVKQDHAGALAFTDKTLKEGGFEGETKQQIIATRAMILAAMKNYDESIKSIDDSIAVAPESEIAKHLAGMKEQISRMKDKEAHKPAGGKKPAASAKTAG